MLKYKLYQYHSQELKWRTVYIFLTGLFSFLVVFLNAPFILYKILPSKTYSNSQIFTEDFIFTEIFEAFFSYLVLSGYFSFLITLPVCYYHVYKFLLPGLSYKESSLLKILCIFSLFLLLFAHLLTYNIILPYATSFFLTFQSGTNINLYPHTDVFTPQITFLGRIYPWITFLIHLFTAVSFLFQLPLFLFITFIFFFLARKDTTLEFTKETPFNVTSLFENKNLGILSSGTFGGISRVNPFTSPEIETFFRKILFFTLLIITAIFSPPDLYSQIFLFIPLFLIIELFLFALFFYFEYSKKITK